MQTSRDYRNALGGLILIIFGASYATYAITQYNLGTLRQMGPGMFPAAAGIMLTAFGAIVLATSLFRPGEKPEIRVLTPLFIFAGIGAFALLIGRFGLIPAVLAVVIISSLAELKVRPVSLLVLCTVLSVSSWMIFRQGLGLPIPMVTWPS